MNQPGFFVHDDFYNITQNDSVKIVQLTPEQLTRSALSNDSGPFKRPVSALTFGLNYYFSGKTFDSASFKRFNIYLHLVNGALIFYLLTLVLQKLQLLPIKQQYLVVFFTTAAWLLHPIQVSTVFYAVQRMTELATLFSLLGILCYLKIRLDPQKAIGYHLALLLLFTLFFLLAIFSKESGLLLPAYCLVIEFMLISHSSYSQHQRKFVVIFFLFFLVIPTIIGLTYILKTGALDHGYQNRPFTLQERLLTEPGIIVFYIKSILIPSYEQYKFLYDFPLVKSLLNPSALLPLAIIGFLISTAIYLRKRQPIIAFGILFYFAGHLLESTILPLELAYEHRNYLASFGLLLATVTLIITLLSRVTERLKVFILTALLIVISANCFLRLSHWGHYQDFVSFQAQQFPDSYTAQFHLGAFYASKVPLSLEKTKSELINKAIYQFNLSHTIKPESIAPLLSIIMLQSQNGLAINQHNLGIINKINTGGVIHAHDTLVLRELMNCQLEKRCKLPSQTMKQIFDPLLSNQNLTNTQKTIILLNISRYMVMLKNNQNALSLAYQATRLAPKDRNTISHFINLLIQLNKHSEANKQINHFLKKDQFGSLKSHLTKEFGNIDGITIQ